MKPTKEIIELSKKLHELGYEQKIERGDWFLIKGRRGLILRSDTSPNLEGDMYLIPIPSLEDGLTFLRKNSSEVYLLGGIAGYWYTRYYPFKTTGSYKETCSRNKHVSTLKAMIKVLENNK